MCGLTHAVKGSSRIVSGRRTVLWFSLLNVPHLEGESMTQCQDLLREGGRHERRRRRVGGRNDKRKEEKRRGHCRGTNFRKSVRLCV